MGPYFFFVIPRLFVFLSKLDHNNILWESSFCEWIESAQEQIFLFKVVMETPK